MNGSDLLLKGTARDIGFAIAQGHLSSLEAVRWYIARIEEHDKGPGGINAIRTISPQAIAQAAAADEELRTSGPRSLLHGVPFLIKDNILSTDGSPASAGSAALKDFMPSHEATLVARLRKAGAVLLGKTNMTEFADFVSDVMPAEFSGAGGVVRNPLGLRYDRGQGSSVGSAAAVAARFCAFAIGSETQNSIQTPAIFSSVFGFKPTVGRVSRHGIVPLVPSQDTAGPLTVCASDAMLVLEAMAGPDMHDTATLVPLPALTRFPLSGGGLEEMAFGIPRRTIEAAQLSPECTQAFERVLSRLSSAGALIIDPCDMPSAEQIHEVRSSVFRTEFKASLNAFLGSCSPCGFTELEQLIEWNARHAKAIPYGQSLLEAANKTEGLRSPGYQADRRRDLALSLDGGILAALRASSADVLLVPMSVAAKCTGKAGAPVAAIPVGQASNGMPFGVTLFAEPGQDMKLLRIAAAIEHCVGERLLPALT
ncbi:amidase family protein [Hydrogenophaga sp.]|jgi:amidase|uniref:amidase family protein n=1 Tax=Hydrogenophaga sp. TaxID=1904254 RepID=UPI003F730089